MSADSQQNLVGVTLAGRYNLTRLLGRGGMGTVYEAKDAQMSDRVVAIKVLAPHLVSDEKQVLRFEQEARAANQLRHPNTISVLDFGRDVEGHIFMVIEFLTGQELTSIVRQGPMDPARALYIMRQVNKSLAEAHSKGIVHRDLKPDNIFVCEIYGEKDFVKVIDFGIAKFLEDESANLTQAGKMFGTPRYLSPEQAQGKRLDARSDLYTCGVILFECLTGRAPFIAEEAIAVAIKHVQEAPPAMTEVNPNTRVPPSVDKLVFKLMSKKPEQRYQSAEEVVAAIDAAMASLGPQIAGFTPHAAMTPARPITIPPASAETDDATRVMESVADDEDEATRALDIPAASADGDATVALDTVAGTPEAATMALDAVAAKDLLQEKAKSKAKPKGGPSDKIRVNTPPQSSASNKFLMVVVVFLLVALAGGAWFVTQGKGNAKTQPKVVKVVQAPAEESEAAKKMRAEAEKARKAAEEAAKAAKALEAQKLELQKKAQAEAKFEVSIETTPPGAELYVNDLKLGTTPYKLSISTKDSDRKIVFKLDGHDDFERTLTTDQVKTLINAKLAKLSHELKKKAAPKPVAAAPAKPRKKKKKASGDLGFDGF